MAQDADERKDHAADAALAAARTLADFVVEVDDAGKIVALEKTFGWPFDDPEHCWVGCTISTCFRHWPADPSTVAWPDRLRGPGGREHPVIVARLRDPTRPGRWRVFARRRSATDPPGSTNFASDPWVRAIIDLVPGFLFAKDADGRFLFVNRVVEKAFGAPNERIIGRTDADFGASAEDVARYRESNRAVIESGRPWTVEREWLVHPDGSSGWYQTTKVPFRDPATGQAAVLGLATDITRRVEAEARLDRESRLARILMRLATDLINLPAEAVDAATDRALAEIGRFVGADRAYVFAYDFGHEIARNTHEWCAEGITPEIDTLKAVPFASMAGWPDRHRRGEAVLIADVGRHPDAALREILERQGIQSLVVVPMPGVPDPAGFVGFDAVRSRREFSEADVQLLRVFAEMLADVWNRLATLRTLERERQRLAAIIEGTNAGTWEWELASGEVRINAQAARMLGYAPDELGPIRIDTWRALVHPDDEADAIEAFRRHLRGDSAQFVSEVRMRHRDGRWVWVLNQGRISARDAGGRAIAMSGTYQDVTERREAEEALRDSEERFRRLFQDVTSVAVQGFDADFTIRFWNRGSERVYGWTAEEAIGRSLIELLVPEADRASAAAEMRDWVFGSPGDRAEEFALVRRDGRPVTVLSSRTVQRRRDGDVEVFCFDIDITEQKAHELDLRLAASVFTHSRDGILIADRDGRVLRANAAFGRITGRPPASIVGRCLSELVLGEADPTEAHAWWNAQLAGGDWSGQFTMRRADGTPIVALLGISAVRDAEGRIEHYVGVLSDVTAESEYQAHLERMAHFDALTGLPNRTLLAARIRDAIGRARASGATVAIAYIDLDGFKAINDSYGHDVGDRFLEAIAQRMGHLLGEVDTLARVGGDEFVALFADLRKPEAADAALVRLRELLSAPIAVGDRAATLSASIGVAYLGPGDDLEADQLLRQADQAMYVAKHEGRNRIHVFDAGLARAEQTRRARLERLRRALAHGEFTLHYQPRVDLSIGRVIGCEALLRWHDPERGLLLPDDFLPTLRGDELEREIGWWVLDQVLRAVEGWRQHGLDPAVSVNVAGEQLLAGDFLTRLRLALGRHPGVPSDRLVLEILETGVLADVARVAALIQECSHLGVGFALDDFGTGYSSLAYLKHLPVRQLKIDRSFVRDMLVDADDLALIEAIVGLARVFGLEVVAEGVEHAEQARALLGLGCPVVQGFAIAPPMPAARFVDWCERWRPDPALLAPRDRRADGPRA
jgi:diguanylate cyclase (GGDEF)-like protein/PAS domain S-box-containing protein